MDVRLIDADALIEEIAKIPDLRTLSTKTIGEAIGRMPTIEPQRKTGRWIFYAVGGWHCSECHCQAPFWCLATAQNLSKFCPDCGTKMEARSDG